MKEVTKEQFKEIYSKYGGGEATGWGLECWKQFFENEKKTGNEVSIGRTRNARAYQDDDRYRLW